MNSVIYGIIFVLANVSTREGGDHTKTYSVITQLGEQMTCYKCNPGQYYIGPCSRDGGSSDCKPCPVGQYNSHYTTATSCAICDTQCGDPAREQVDQNCSSQSNILCLCKDGFYRVNTWPSLCIFHDTCPPGKGVKKIGNPYNNTVCEICLEGYYSGIASKTEGCKQCTKCSANETVLQECTSTNNTICIPKEKEKPKKGNPYNTTVREICLEGYYSGIASKTEGCKRCTKCSANEKVLQECTSTNNTICTLKEKEKPKKGWIIVVSVVGLGLLGIVGAIVCIFYCSKHDIKNKSKPSTSDSGQVDKEQPGENGKGQDVEKKPLIKDNPDGKHSNGVVPQNCQEDESYALISQHKGHLNVTLHWDSRDPVRQCSTGYLFTEIAVVQTHFSSLSRSCQEDYCIKSHISSNLELIRIISKEYPTFFRLLFTGDADKRTHENNKDKVNKKNVYILQEIKKLKTKNKGKAITFLIEVKNSDSESSGNTDIDSGHADTEPPIVNSAAGDADKHTKNKEEATNPLEGENNCDSKSSENTDIGS